MRAEERAEPSTSGASDYRTRVQPPCGNSSLGIHAKGRPLSRHYTRPLHRQRFSEESIVMLHYAIVFLVIALIAAVLGFGGIAGAAAGIAKILFVVSLVMGRRRPPI
jgi:uncharacterized membrane protein YtjA (UPF0391 family)